jgi:hypothetical protein
MATQGTNYLGQLSNAVAPLAVINPYANPMIEAFAQSLESMGGSLAPAISPLGPTVVQFGADARFFEGS